MATIISLALLGGTALSFVPQWVSIIQEKSSRGVSVFAQSFGTMGCFTQFYCAFLLVFRCGLFGEISSHDPVGAACAGSNFLSWNCQQLLLALYLTGSFVVGQVPILTLVGIYFQPEIPAEIVKETRFLRMCMIFTWTYLTLLIIVGLGMLLFNRNYDSFHYLGEIITPFGALCMASTYIPQIITTWRLKRKGALSLLTLAIQVPGAGMVGISLIFDGQSWDVVLPSLASCSTGAILLAEVIYFELRARAKRKTTLQHEFTSPLLYDAKKQSFEVLYP
jgi:uncharacterized protein with PQ loop repeat